MCFEKLIKTVETMITSNLFQRLFKNHYLKIKLNRLTIEKIGTENKIFDDFIFFHKKVNKLEY